MSSLSWQLLCGFAKDAPIPSYSLLPDGPVVEAKFQEARLHPLTMYMLRGQIAPWDGTNGSVGSPSSTPPSNALATEPIAKPNPRSSKFSGFLERTLDQTRSEWDGKDLRSVATPEKLRRSFDIVVLALYFQAMLRLHGYRDSRKVVQLACGLVTMLHAEIRRRHWAPQERAMVVLAFEPLVSTPHAVDEAIVEPTFWSLMCRPEVTSGMSSRVMSQIHATSETSNAVYLRRPDLQKTLWDIEEVSSPKLYQHER